MGVALAAPASPGQKHLVSGDEEIGQEFAGLLIKNEGAEGYFDDKGIALAAAAVLSLAPPPRLGGKDAAALKGSESAEGGRGFQVDVAAGAAIAAVRPAAGLEPGAGEAYAAGAPLAGPDGDFRLIREGLQLEG